jgi:HK97 family phage major capsid protein
MNFTNPTLDTIHAAAIVVVTDEVLQSAAPGAEAAFARALRQGVSDVVDERFLTEIAPAVATIATASPQTDLRNLLTTVNSGGAGVLYWVMSPRVANVISTKIAANGQRLFEGMTPTGGQLLGLPALVTNQMPNIGGSPATLRDSLWLVDASQIAANAETIEVDLARHTTLEMDNAPTMDGIAPTATQVVSLWQTDSVAIRAQTWFGCEKLTSNAVAVLDAVLSLLVIRHGGLLPLVSGRARRPQSA